MADEKEKKVADTSKKEKVAKTKSQEKTKTKATEKKEVTTKKEENKTVENKTAKKEIKKEKEVKKTAPPTRKAAFTKKYITDKLKSTYFMQSSISLANSSSTCSKFSFFFFVQRQFNDLFNTVLTQDYRHTTANI